MTALVREQAVAADWQPVVDGFFTSAEGMALAAFLAARHAAGARVFPPEPLLALRLTPLARVRAVILGQDPYHGAGQAEGLAFSVPAGVKPPPSLRNIFKELRRDLGPAEPASGSLQAWAERGVLLLNTCLTVEEGQAGSHARQGWEVLTDALIATVAAHVSPCVYLLWGAHAQSKASLIARETLAHERRALVLQANHPSPLSALRLPTPFLGCGHFGRSQRWMAEQGALLDWSLPGPEECWQRSPRN